jgi:hypothetical protein
MDNEARTIPLEAASWALEQGQAPRPEATFAAKTCMVDSNQATDGTPDARLGDVQPRKERITRSFVDCLANGTTSDGNGFTLCKEQCAEWKP